MNCLVDAFRACFEMGATAGLSSSAKRLHREKHCWSSQQCHPTVNRKSFFIHIITAGARLLFTTLTVTNLYFSVQLSAAENEKPNTQKLKVVSKTLFVKSPPGGTAFVNTSYTRGKGLEKMCVRFISRRCDTFDDFSRRFSTDNGKTWSPWESTKGGLKEKTPQGTHRQYVLPSWIDPGTGRMIVLVLDGVLPTDDPLEGMMHWKMRYRVSDDGGRTFTVDEAVIQKGDYTPDHPVEGVWIGKNSIQTSGSTGLPIRTREENLLVPVAITPLGPDGKYWKPAGAYTYTDTAVLVGHWAEGKKIEWDISERVKADHTKTIRGFAEPTLAEMPDGRILMVMRGSNGGRKNLPGYAWYSVSNDGGHKWNKPKPWTYADGSNFFTPASVSGLLRHSNGKCYWIGNITPTNPRGGLPRYPLFIGQVDPKNLLLLKETLTKIDDKGPDDNEKLQLSNFSFHEDRVTGEIVLDMTRATPSTGRWDNYTYRIIP
ncbi:MAG: exo-alpha-sialidase [Pirellulales bacterium]|nr:exo-alpha-sialidase [Pirellulales bacterium]